MYNHLNKISTKITEIIFHNSKGTSLIKSLLYSCGFITAFIMLMSILLSLDYYHVYKNEQLKINKREAQKLAFAMDDKFILLEDILRFIGNKIKECKTQEDIGNLLKSHPKLFRKNNIAWNTINYIDKEGWMRSDSLSGNKQNIFKISNEERSWIKEAKIKTWHLLYSKPDIDPSTNELVIPAALGISDTNKVDSKFYGYLSVSINIDKLTSIFKSLAGENVGFIIIDKDSNVVLASDHSLATAAVQSMDKIDTHHIQTLTYFEEPMQIGNYTFHYAAASLRMPLIILVGQDSVAFAKEIKVRLIPRLLIYALTIIMFVIAAGAILFKVLNPILQLNKMAMSISQDQQLPSYKFYYTEFETLANKIKQIWHMTKDLRAKQLMLSRINSDLNNANSFIKSNMSFLSHELINPVSSVIGFAELIQSKAKEYKDEELREYTSIIYDVAHYQNKQLNYFLNLFKFQESRKKVAMQEVQLKQLIDWNVSMMKKRADDKSIKIEVNVPNSMKIIADEIMIGQVVQNLISNAVKYNAIGGKLTIDAKSNQQCLILSFKDTGIGISQDDIGKLFKKFSRLKASKKSVGYGVGLAYAKHCIDAHNGSIAIESEVNIGTTFIITIPACVICK